MTPLEKCAKALAFPICAIERDVRVRDLTDAELQSLARACLTALMEPGEHALAGAWTEIDKHKEQRGIAGPGPAAREIWQAMFKEILK